DWTTDPNDKIALVAFFKTIKEKIGRGGSWDATSLEAAAVHMRARGHPVKGAEKNANSVKGCWNGLKKIHDALVLVIQNRFPGASRWTYDQQRGFSVCDDNRDEWKKFVKQHSILKPFANKGWELFDDVKEILLAPERDVHVFNAATPTVPSTPSSNGLQLHSSDDKSLASLSHAPRSP
ncbi:hypothetical protein R3P38DRAFT_2369598, partial [Favolaschia claudopus]